MLGIIWLPVGLIMGNTVFWMLGLVYTVLGLANRDKWKDEKKWSDLSPNERNIRLVVVVGLTLVLAVGIVVLLLNRAG